MGMFTDSTNPYDIKSNTTSPLYTQEKVWECLQTQLTLMI